LITSHGGQLNERPRDVARDLGVDARRRRAQGRTTGWRDAREHRESLVQRS
jgi:hypothetical protein